MPQWPHSSRAARAYRDLCLHFHLYCEDASQHLGSKTGGSHYICHNGLRNCFWNFAPCFKNEQKWIENELKIMQGFCNQKKNNCWLVFPDSLWN